MRIALGSTRAAKIAAVRSAAERIGSIDARWAAAEIFAGAVETDAPAMPLSDDHLMLGAKARALAVRSLVQRDDAAADFYVGLEGGFHTTTIEGAAITFLKGWAYVTDGIYESFGASPSIVVPRAIVRSVSDGARELSEVIDETAGEKDVRSRQGAWGVLSRDLFTRSMSFEVALVAAFAPYYNEGIYDR